jgi:hypothetical protein
MVASLVGIGATLWIERRRAEQAQAATDREVRIAARAVVLGLATRQAEFESVIDDALTPAGGLVGGRDAWERHEATLLGHLKQDEFMQVAAVYTRMLIFQRAFFELYEFEDGTDRVRATPPKSVDQLKKLLDAVDDALRALYSRAVDD